MPQYDFLNLSASEFENLSRDLLQCEFGVHIESFTEGSDGGIDLRFATVEATNQVIQCKRYREFNSLYSNLKKEIKKLKDLNPQRYFLTTSVELTPNRKKQIFKLFARYIKNEEDIFGKDDLNNLLGKHKEIEKQHFKLWLSSLTVLEKILHSKIYNQTQFELDEIKDLIRLYVQNDSFNESLKILNENNFVIISGIPGIGKTTLARILVYHLLSKGYEEFAFLSDNISEGYKVFQEGKKQVFLFDDFLGRNFLEKSTERNEEQNIVRFIEKIKKTPNKALIFTTREYILNQAQIRYEIFNKGVFEKNKCLVDLSKYTKRVKAQILYNHLYFNTLPAKYAKEILKNRFYLKLIEHPNYNPRIIETFTQNKVWEEVEAKRFCEQLKSYFDNPDRVWKHAYENQITDFSKYILAILLTTGAPIFYEDLLAVAQHFGKNLSDKYKLKFSELEFKKSLKELENTFISIKNDDKKSPTIEYQNPSIQDFLVNYIGEQNDLVYDLINNAIFFNQLVNIFGYYNELLIDGKVVKFRNKIFLEGTLLEHLFDKFSTDFDKLKSSRLEKIHFSNSKTFYWRKANYNDIQKLARITWGLLIDEHPNLRTFIKSKFLEIIKKDIIDLKNDEIDDFMNILRIYKNEIDVKIFNIFSKIASQLYWYDDLFSFSQFEKIYPKDYKKYMTSKEFKEEILPSILENEYESADDDNLDDILYNLERLEEKYEIDASYEVSSIKGKIANKESDSDSEVSFNDIEDLSKNKKKSADEDFEIMTMFNSLKHI
jgi:Restriction endonuclease